MTAQRLWLAIGLLGQLMFTLRFLVQWVQSERQKKSVTPVVFWYFSLAGGLTLLTYAIHKRDLVFIIGQATGLLIYVRNIQLVTSERRDSREMPHGLPTA